MMGQHPFWCVFYGIIENPNKKENVMKKATIGKKVLLFLVLAIGVFFILGCFPNVNTKPGVGRLDSHNQDQRMYGTFGHYQEEEDNGGGGDGDDH